MAEQIERKSFEIGKDKNSEIIDAIMEIITKYYPVTENRHKSLLSLRGNANSYIDIDITYAREKGKDVTGISFSDYKSSRSLPDFLEIDGLLNDSLLYDLFTVILKDHDWISSFFVNNSILQIKTDINWTDQNLTGINCREINFNFDFYYHPDKDHLMEHTIQFFTLNFFEQLQGTSFMKEALTSYFSQVKQLFIDSLSSDDIRKFICMLDDEALIEIINDLPNNVFTPIYTKFNEERTNNILTKKLKGDNNDNN